MGLRGQSGNVILLLLLLLVGLAGGGYYFMSPSAVSEREQAERDARVTYDEAVAALERALNDPRQIDASVERNAAFQCLFSLDGNCQGRGGNFLVFESKQSPKPLSQLARDAGFDRFGSVCQGYPSKECPIQAETVWDPACNNAHCEGTKAFRVKATVTLAPMAEGQPPLVWHKEGMFAPTLQLSQATVCARGGGTWSGTECLTPGQVAERQIASPGAARAEEAPPLDSREDRAQGEMPQLPVQYICPNQIVVQGMYYPVQRISEDRAQVSVPAASCPAGPTPDVFVFQCAARPVAEGEPPPVPGSTAEGQWIQVEAVMAPACDQFGNPLGGDQSAPARY